MNRIQIAIRLGPVNSPEWSSWIEELVVEEAIDIRRDPAARLAKASSSFLVGRFRKRVVARAKIYPLDLTVKGEDGCLPEFRQRI